MEKKHDQASSKTRLSVDKIGPYQPERVNSLSAETEETDQLILSLDQNFRALVAFLQQEEIFIPFVEINQQ